MGMLQRALDLLQAHIGRLLSALERRNPEALLQLEKEKLRKLIGRFNEGLVSHAALSERLISHVKRGAAEEADLAERVRALLRAGKESAAADLALQRKRVAQRLAEDRLQLEAAETTYENLVRTRDAAVAEIRNNIEAVRREIGDLKVQRAKADLETMVASMVGELGTASDSFNRLREMVSEERHAAAARSRVAGTQPAAQDLAAREAEQRALAEEALREFRAEDRSGSEARLIPLPDRSADAR